MGKKILTSILLLFGFAALSYGALDDNDIARVENIVNKIVKEEVSALRKEFKEEISGLRGEISGLRGEISALREEFKGDISALRKELKEEMSALRRDFKDEIRDKVGTLTGTVLAGFSILGALMVALVASPYIFDYLKTRRQGKIESEAIRELRGEIERLKSDVVTLKKVSVQQ
ncbi:MAG: hypothetical protein ACUVXI_05910 [bacterium]